MNFFRNALLVGTASAATALCIAATSVHAQAVDIAAPERTVTIRFEYGGDGITGQLISFEENKLRIETTVGTITIPAEDVSCIGAACPESLRLAVEASPIVLTSLDGQITLSGDLLEIAGNEYVVATAAGELRIETDKVTCQGEGCVVEVSAPVFGGPVVLTNGATEISGNLVGVDETSYLVEVENLGAIRVQLDSFTCTGEGCPAG
ncbi:hypothetical protein [Cognatiyoonia sp. IB215182]|uniref:hypothetical protein n=1 Tax=Cognatiyoonia sp. IB215182 TaxID=3097353 RepID=UPI002A17A424|nr:hypothetical protein [Cognatiyoonia sp. IB215182]MDX8352851.1 hypothetical protein [Cognatiyoonia sp. IB215182]